MPAYTRKSLRQTLGQSYIRDMIASNTYASQNVAQVGGFFANSLLADSSLIGQGLYENASVRHNAGSFDYRVSSFNAASGAFVTSQVIAAVVNYNDSFEVHTRLPASEKDRAIDDTIKEIRLRQEVGIMTVDGETFYDIEGRASPHYITDILDAYYFASPGGSLDRGQTRLVDFQMVRTASGREVRISPALAGSQQIILDAILELTLGSADTALVPLPDDGWILAGAAARCYGMMIQNTPGQNAGELLNRRTEWARKFTSLSSRFGPYPYDRKIRLGETDF